MTPLLDVEGLVVEVAGGAGAGIVRGLSVQVEVGQSLGLVGESGCGKTVSMLAVLGLLDESVSVSGDIRYRGARVETASEVAALRGSRIAMIFQDAMRALNPLMTVGAQITESLRFHQGMTRRQARAAAVEQLARVGLRAPDSLVARYPHELSGGMRQRVMIAAALACGPELLIADEPTTGLDVTIQAQILELLREIQQRDGLGIVFISHDLAAVAQLCDDISVVYGGRVVEHGPTPEILGSPSHPYTAALLDAVPECGRREPLAGIEGLPPVPGDHPPGCSFQPRCPHALEVCREQPPEPTRSGAGRMVECWLAVGDEGAGGRCDEGAGGRCG